MFLLRKRKQENRKVVKIKRKHIFTVTVTIFYFRNYDLFVSSDISVGQVLDIEIGKILCLISHLVAN